MARLQQEDALRIMQDLQRSQQEERSRSDSLEHDLAAMRGELERQVGTSQRISADARQFKQAVEAATATLQHERQNAQMLAEELATMRRELETLSAGAAKTTGDNAATVRELGELRAALQQLKEQKAIDDEILVRKQPVCASSSRKSPRRRCRRRKFPPACPSRLASIQAPAPVAAQGAQPMPTNKVQSTATNDQSASNTSWGADGRRVRTCRGLMARARELLRQGDIAAARNVLSGRPRHKMRLPCTRLLKRSIRLSSGHGMCLAQGAMLLGLETFIPKHSSAEFTRPARD